MRLDTIRILAAVALMTLTPAERSPGHNSPLNARGPDAFRPLDRELPSPSPERLASGAPGPGYWQQRADYRIEATIDEATDSLRGDARITYTNNSPHELAYLWVHLDQNRFAKLSAANRSRVVSNPEELSFYDARNLLGQARFEGGVTLEGVRDSTGHEIRHTVVGTQMRIDLKEPLKPGAAFTFSVAWTMPVTPIPAVDDRAGVQQLEGEGRKIYNISQWYPRMTAYTDVQGWHIKQFLGTGEFTLEFGDFDVELTVPADHFVAATGTLTNVQEMLGADRAARLDRARTSERPIYVVTADESADHERTAHRRTKTWHFKAQNVRDFAFASSRSFIWQAWGVKLEGRPDPVQVMAFYPQEASPLWDQFAVHATAHALEVYSRHTVPYPYPVISTVYYDGGGGMEYPMITFNDTVPEVDPKTGDRTYSRQDKIDLIGVIIHETGHQFLPMVVNSDERQWMWLDEGLNSFIETIAERNWEKKFPVWFEDLAEWMAGDDQVPIMTPADQLQNTGNNAYAKVAAALTVLREVVLGRELFDFAFRTYAQRWKFKRPMPADFFRTMEDASGVDLDWFWRGWFYTTQHVDLAIDDVRRFRIGTQNPDVEHAWDRAQDLKKPAASYERREATETTRIERFVELRDLYNEKDEYTVTDKDRNEYDEILEELKPWQREVLAAGESIYALTFSNVGGLVMPLPLRIEYRDGSVEELTLDPAIWRRNATRVTHLLVRDADIASVVLDPHRDLYDANYDDNAFPRTIEERRIDVAADDDPPRNLMKDLKEKREAGDRDR